MRTSEHRQVLEALFLKQPRPSAEQLLQLEQVLGRDIAWLKWWFKDARSRSRLRTTNPKRVVSSAAQDNQKSYRVCCPTESSLFVRASKLQQSTSSVSHVMMGTTRHVNRRFHQFQAQVVKHSFLFLHCEVDCMQKAEERLGKLLRLPSTSVKNKKGCLYFVAVLCK